MGQAVSGLDSWFNCRPWSPWQLQKAFVMAVPWAGFKLQGIGSRESLEGLGQGQPFCAFCAHPRCHGAQLTDSSFAVSWSPPCRNTRLVPVTREQEGNSALLGLRFVPLTSGRAKEGALDVVSSPYFKAENPHTPNMIDVDGFKFFRKTESVQGCAWHSWRQNLWHCELGKNKIDSSKQ